MHTYEFTYKDGDKARLKAENIEAALQLVLNNHMARTPSELIQKIECIDKAIIRHDVQQVNTRLHEYGTDFHDAHEVMPYIREILATNGFDVSNLDSIEAGNQQGELRCVDIGRDVYLCVTWYRMPTGRYEVVAYVS